MRIKATPDTVADTSDPALLSLLKQIKSKQRTTQPNSDTFPINWNV
jgi:hypothetical protein